MFFHLFFNIVLARSSFRDLKYCRQLNSLATANLEDHKTLDCLTTPKASMTNL